MEKNTKLIEIINKIEFGDINQKINDLVEVEIEYALRFSEVNRIVIIKKFKFLFGDEWEGKLKIFMLLLYTLWIEKSDIRFLNILYKLQVILKKIDLELNDKKLYKIVKNDVYKLST